MFEGVNDIKKVKIAIKYNEKNYRKASFAEKPICLRN
jgi:hypothetical protein